jgi:hypothetical protein
MGLWRIPRWIRLEDEERERQRARRASYDVLRPALRLIVCGDTADRTFVFDALARVTRTHRVGCLLVPDDSGAAAIAADWGTRHGVVCTEFVAEWDAFGVNARLLRNAELFRAWPSGVVVLGTDRSGLGDCARASRVPVWNPRAD